MFGKGLVLTIRQATGWTIYHHLSQANFNQSDQWTIWRSQSQSREERLHLFHREKTSAVLCSSSFNEEIFYSSDIIDAIAESSLTSLGFRMNSLSLLPQLNHASSLVTGHRLERTTVVRPQAQWFKPSKMDLCVILQIQLPGKERLSMPHLKTLILTSVNVLLILSLLGAHKCRILRPRWKRHPCVIQNLQYDIQVNSNFCLSKTLFWKLSTAKLLNLTQSSQKAAKYVIKSKWVKKFDTKALLIAINQPWKCFIVHSEYEVHTYVMNTTLLT